MPKYQVLRALEHDYVFYLPAGSGAPKKVASAGHGLDIDTDTSGFVELSEDQAAPLLPEGVVAPQRGVPPPPAEAGPQRKKK